MSENREVEADRPMGRIYAAVVALEVLIIALLWLLGRAYA